MQAPHSVHDAPSSLLEALYHPHGYCYLWQTDLVAAHVQNRPERVHARKLSACTVRPGSKGGGQIHSSFGWEAAAAWSK